MKECNAAQVAFSQLPHLKKHMLSIHGKDKPYGKKIKSRPDLKIHLNSFLVCEICREFFKTKQELQMHTQNCFKDGDKDQILNENVRA